MPCRHDPDEYPMDKIAKAATDPREERRKADQKHIDKLTRMLCTILAGVKARQLDLMKDLDLASGEMREVEEWHSAHKEWDRQRLAKARKSAIDMLSDEQLEALGLEREDSES